MLDIEHKTIWPIRKSTLCAAHVCDTHTLTHTFITICMYGKWNSDRGGKCILHFTIYTVKFTIIINSSFWFNVLLLFFFTVVSSSLHSNAYQTFSSARKKKQIPNANVHFLHWLSTIYVCVCVHLKFHPLYGVFIHPIHIVNNNKLNSEICNLYWFTHFLLLLLKFNCNKMPIIHLDMCKMRFEQ